jgi:hypothetical protein
MILLGFRASPNGIRYAVVNIEGQNVQLINKNLENKLIFPADHDTLEKKLYWLYTEVERILVHYKTISAITIKSSEFGKSAATKSSRDTTSFEGIILLIAHQQGIPISLKYYRNLNTNSKSVKSNAESIVGSLSTLISFDEKMADAIVAAYSGRSL